MQVQFFVNQFQNKMKIQIYGNFQQTAFWSIYQNRYVNDNIPRLHIPILCKANEMWTWASILLITCRLTIDFTVPTANSITSSVPCFWQGKLFWRTSLASLALNSRQNTSKHWLSIILVCCSQSIHPEFNHIHPYMLQSVFKEKIRLTGAPFKLSLWACWLN